MLRIVPYFSVSRFRCMCALVAVGFAVYVSGFSALAGPAVRNVRENNSSGTRVPEHHQQHITHAMPARPARLPTSRLAAQSR